MPKRLGLVKNLSENVNLQGKINELLIQSRSKNLFYFLSGKG